MCREFGFGLQISDNKLAIINKSRENKKYVDDEAAQEVLGTSK